MSMEIRRVLRGIWANWLSSAAIVLSLGLGIGLNAVAFGVLDKVVLSPFSFTEFDRLVVLWGAPSFSERRGMNGHDIDDWARASSTVDAATVFQLTPFRFSLGTAGEALQGAQVGVSFFSILGVEPVFGRTFLAEDAGVVVISHELWNSWLGQDPDIVGRSISVNGESRQVVGVMPEGFFFLDRQTRLWAPLRQDSADYRQVHALARLNRGVTAAQVEDEVNAVLQDRLSINSRTGQRIPVGVFPLRRLAVAEHERATWLLYGAVTLLWLGACANVSSLLLARSLDRSREFAICTALGGSRWRVSRLIAGEAMLLAGLAGACSLLFADWSIALLQRLDMLDIPRLQAVTIDRGVVAHLAAATMVSGVACGIVPTLAVAGSRHSLSLLNADAATPTRGIGQLRQMLLASEVWATVILLVGAGLLARTFLQLSAVDWGFSPDNVVVAETTLPWSAVQDQAGLSQLTEGVLTRMAREPGVESQAMTLGLPIRWHQWSPIFVARAGSVVQVGAWTVSHDYFSTLGIPLRRGREFSVRDSPLDRAVVVNDRFAKRLWPGANPIGRQFHLLKPSENFRQQIDADRSVAYDRTLLMASESWTADGPPWTVLGEVGDVRTFGLQDAQGAAIYFDYRARDSSSSVGQSFVVRGRNGTDGIGLLLKSAILASHPEVRVDAVFDFEEIVSRSIGSRGSRALLTLVSLLLGGLALGLAAVGTYSMASLSVARRLKEIAVRRTLGASFSDVVQTVWLPHLRVIALAICAGLAASYAAARALGSLLYGVSPADALTYATVTLLVIVIAMLGAISPLRRAARANPAELLRVE